MIRLHAFNFSRRRPVIQPDLTRRVRCVLAAILVLGLARAAAAQQVPVDKVAWNQKLDGPVAADATFTDDHGRTVRFGDLLSNKPAVVMLGFYQCPMLCDLVLQNLSQTLKRVDLTPGKDFDVIVLSIDPTETTALAAAKKKNMIAAYGRPETAKGWRFLTGRQDQIDTLAASVGFGYAPLPGGQFSHPAGLIVLTPTGHNARYLMGMRTPPRDMRLALVEASQGKIGTFSDAILLRCYHYDPATGKYGFAIQTTLRVAGCGMVLVMAGGILFMARKYRQKPLTAPRPAGGAV